MFMIVCNPGNCLGVNVIISYKTTQQDNKTILMCRRLIRIILPFGPSYGKLEFYKNFFYLKFSKIVPEFSE